MRKLMWFAIGFTAACALGIYVFAGNWLLLLTVLCAALLLAMALIFQGRGKSALLLVTGCLAAFLWLWIYNAAYLSIPKDYDGQTMDTEIKITDYSEPKDYGISAQGIITLDGKKYKIKIYSYDLTELSPGDIVAGNTELLYTPNTEWSKNLSSSGIHLVGYTDEEATVITADSVPVKYFAAQLRLKITRFIDVIFPNDTAAFARALLLGDTSRLTYETDTALSISGIRHVVAVSGLHVSILFSLVYSFVGYRKILTPAVGLPVLLLFAAIAGFTPSVNRACIMQALVILAMLFDREYDPPTALSFAVLTMLVINPMTVTSASFQMSVGCMVGIFLFSGRIQQYLSEKVKIKSRVITWIIGCVSVTLSTMVTVTPLCAYYFGTISIISVLTNLLTLWAITILFCGIMAACVLGAIWLPLGKGIAWLLSWLIRYVLFVSDTFASFPLAAVYTQSVYIVLWLILCYILLVIFLTGKKKQPGLFLCSVVLSLCMAVAASWIEPRLDDYRMTVLDVGQGQCILLQNEDRHYVIDCGGEYDEGTADLAAQTLLSQGITELDGLILTHYDVDHAGAAAYLLSRIPAKRLYLPDIADDGTVRESLTQGFGNKIQWIGSDETLALDDGQIMLFAGNTEKRENESGLCILCQIKNCDILITGDRSTAGENVLLEQVRLPDLEVLVVGHHGSAYSTGFSLLTATTPEIAVISVGEDNRYNHPAQETLDRLTLFGCQILRTDENGTIIIRG